MYDYSQTSDASRSSSQMMGFWIGAMVGASIALLLAPARGEETRHRIGDAAKKIGRDARHTFNKAGDVARSLKDDARSAVESGKEAFRREKPGNTGEYSRPTV
jgi:gas vesicle protein